MEKVLTKENGYMLMNFSDAIELIYRKGKINNVYNVGSNIKLKI